MAKVLENSELAPNLVEMVVVAPRIAAKAQPGQFVIAMADATGERIPLTIADFDREAGTITMVVAVVGASSMKFARVGAGQSLHALIGPLGMPSEIDGETAVVMVAGGVGAAPIYPIARAFHEAGSQVITIQGSRSKDLLFWTDKLASVSARHIITTDDGSYGRTGRVTEPLRDLLAEDSAKSIQRVCAIGPPIMMKFCCETTRPFEVHTIVSLNSIMVDGTGMCGGCRVEVGGQTKFTCVDGPEFDGHQVAWDQLMSRQRAYHSHEACSMDRYVAQHNKDMA
jgi:ferredoxin--NADP+ reductase